MDVRTKEICDRIIRNRNELKPEMIWDAASNMNAIMGAMIAAANGQDISRVRYAQCKRILKKNAGMFSEFRGIARPLVITKMALQEDPETYLNGAMVVYKKLRHLHKLTASSYMVMAALTIYENGGTAYADQNIEKLEELYKLLKQQHPMLIWDTDRGYLSMLAVSNSNNERVAEGIEDCYQACKHIALDKDAVHSLAQVLVLSGKSLNEKTEEVKTIVKELKHMGKPISKSYGLSSVGALELLSVPTEEKIQLIAEVDDYLKHEKGFRWYNEGGRIRRMYACLIVLMAYSSRENAMITSNIEGTVVMTVVETIITMMIIAAANASASASASSSGSH